MMRPGQFFEVCERFYDGWQEIDGCIVSDKFHGAKKTVRRLLDEGYAREDIERFCNHTHASMLLEVFGKDTGNTAKDRGRVADFHEAITSYRLMKKYPDMRFAFERAEEDGDIEITYYRVRVE